MPMLEGVVHWQTTQKFHNIVTNSSVVNERGASTEWKTKRVYLAIAGTIAAIMGPDPINRGHDALL